jgi:hypothetical protein
VKIHAAPQPRSRADCRTGNQRCAAGDGANDFARRLCAAPQLLSAEDAARFYVCRCSRAGRRAGWQPSRQLGNLGSLSSRRPGTCICTSVCSRAMKTEGLHRWDKRPTDLRVPVVGSSSGGGGGGRGRVAPLSSAHELTVGRTARAPRPRLLAFYERLATLFANLGIERALSRECFVGGHVPALAASAAVRQACCVWRLWRAASSHRKK